MYLSSLLSLDDDLFFFKYRGERDLDLFRGERDLDLLLLFLSLSLETLYSESDEESEDEPLRLS